MTKSNKKRKTAKRSKVSGDPESPPQASPTARLATNEHTTSDTGTTLSDPSMPEKQSDETRSSTQLNASERKHANRRKRKHPALATSTETPSQKPLDKAIFNGLIFAISTLESTKTTDVITEASNADGNEESAEIYNNFKTLTNVLKTYGAAISPQVHKRVHYLVSTRHAVNNLTQRVRQALKRNVDIVDASWIKECVKRGARVETKVYLLNSLAMGLMSIKEKEKSEATRADDSEKRNKHPSKDGYESYIPDASNTGWSSPIQLDCCCVCHENGDDNCPWCTECNLTLAKSKK
ncbi:hypothetical protein HJC23_002648 [Cyclotella cryptica]|uniref:BRCT domain-containing protein n=1 Tax=Cyclotella cryptica TaxID=29204 RepID=A0ABD3PMN7_9STRA|eukprot:CCRYP_013534-RB/>CCRYP_013534-RB protein AED:0.01 eAED:0.01 QI:158/-1/1/1/-1/1/1/46/293